MNARWWAVVVAAAAWIATSFAAAIAGHEHSILIVGGASFAVLMVLLLRAAKAEEGSRPSMLAILCAWLGTTTALGAAWGAIRAEHNAHILLAIVLAASGFTAAAGINMRTALHPGPALYWRRALFGVMAFIYSGLAWYVNPGWSGWLYGMTAIDTAVLWFIADQDRRARLQPLLLHLERQPFPGGQR